MQHLKIFPKTYYITKPSWRKWKQNERTLCNDQTLEVQYNTRPSSPQDLREQFSFSVHLAFDVLDQEWWIRMRLHNCGSVRLDLGLVSPANGILLWGPAGASDVSNKQCHLDTAPAAFRFFSFLLRAAAWTNPNIPTERLAIISCCDFTSYLRKEAKHCNANSESGRNTEKSFL